MVRASSVLPAPGGPTSSRAWPPGQRDLQRPARLGLAAHVGQIDRLDRGHGARPDAAAAPDRPHAGRRPRRGPPGAGWRPRRAGRGDPPPAARRRPGRAPPRPPRRPRGGPRRRWPAGTAMRRWPAPHEGATIGRSPDTACRLPSERELAEQGPAPPPARTCSERDEDADGDRQVERRARLGPVGRGEVDRDPTGGVLEAGVPDGGPDPLARLRQGGVRQADEARHGEPRGDVHLDADERAGEAVDDGRDEGGQHGPAVWRPPLIARLVAGRRAASAARGVSR